MHTFFHGWRRKAGVATLVVALALLGIWIRSLGRTEGAHVFPRSTLWGVVWRNGSFSVIQSAYQSHRAAASKSAESCGTRLQRFSIGHFSKPSTPETNEEYFTGTRVHADSSNDWKFGGFVLVTESYWTSNDVHEDMYLLVPCWFVTIPLTLLSAYLLLWKPRKRA